MKTTPLLSVVVPVYNGGPQLERCLAALLASDFHDYEIVVVDDGSTDGSAEVARALGLEVIRLGSQSGPAAARNRGASGTRGDIILFVDADVVVQRDTLTRIIAIFQSRSTTAAVFGSYDDAPTASGFVSQYKNLLHHFVHQQSNTEANTFWAGCGAIRRKAFEAVGGFDESRYRRPSIEDIELGDRLRRAGFQIILDQKLQVTHLKNWTFRALLGTDIFNRALPWSQLILERGEIINDLNLRVRDRLCAGLAGLAFASLLLSYFSITCLTIMLAALAGIFLLNHRFHSFLKERRGQWFALRSFPLLALYYFYSGTVFALCYCAHVLKNRLRLTRGARRATVSGRMNDA